MKDNGKILTAPGGGEGRRQAETSGATRRLVVEAPGGERRVLLHTCCAPCSSAIVERLMHSGIEPVIYYCNPNIYPLEEYEIRKNECTRYAQALGLEIVDADYDHEAWLDAVRGLENEPERGARCQKCFALRLDRAAEYAAAHGFKVLTTTLASSRWKSLDQINLAGRAAASRHNVIWWDQNWRKGGLQERRSALIKEYNFYNQRYCGCEFSFCPDLPKPSDCKSAGTFGSAGTFEPVLPDL